MKNNKIKDSAQIVRIILTSVKFTDVGKYKLAEFLKGSKAKGINYLKGMQGYGGLMFFSIDEIIGFIEQLEKMELISKKETSEYRKILTLTLAGQKVLHEQIPIEIQAINKTKKIIVGPSEEISFTLFNQGLSLEEIARQRDLKISTIYDHMFKLVSNEYVKCSQFMAPETIKTVLKITNKNKFQKLKQIKELLPKQITYGEIRCILADKSIRGINNDY